MRYLAVVAGVGSAFVVGLACGGPAFSVGGEGDASVDSTTEAGLDAAGDAGSDSAPLETSGPDAPFVDAPGVDALEEPPATCAGGFACVPAIPAGWTGPLEVYSGTSAVPPCSSMFGTPQDANDLLVAASATCGCLCGTAGVQCSTPQLLFFPGSTCGTSNLCASVVLTPSTCTAVDETGKCDAGVAGVSVTSAQAGVLDAGCVATAKESLPPVSWGTNARACASEVATAQLDCAAGSVCAPKPAPPFAATACIATAGDVPCPSGAYSTRHVFFGGVDDTRGCTACTCAAQGFSCSAKLDAYSSGATSCSGLPNSYPAPFTCEVVDQPAQLLMTITPTLGTCTPSQSTAQGAATAAKPLTVCCAP